MAAGWWLSVGLGAGLGLFYGLASYLSWRVTRGIADAGRFVLLYFSLMMGRMALALIAVTLLLVLAPVGEMPFLAAFFIVFVMGLAAEVAHFHTRQLAASKP